MTPAPHDAEPTGRALVTGVGRGLGRATAAELLGRGWVVTGIARRDGSDELDDHPRFHRRVLDLEDLASRPSIPALVTGPLDLLVNNAGVRGAGTGVLDMSVEELRTVTAVNVLAPFALLRHLLPHLEAARQPLVLNVSSRLASLTSATDGAYDAFRDQLSTAYLATKGSLNALTVAVAHDLAGRGIAVHAVHPGTIRTGLGRPDAARSAEEAARRLVDAVDQLRATPCRTLVDLTDDVAVGSLPW